MRRLLVPPGADERTDEGDGVYAYTEPGFVALEGRHELCRGNLTKEDGADVQAGVD